MQQMSTRIVDVAQIFDFSCSERSSNKTSLGHALSSFTWGQEGLLVCGSRHIMHFMAQMIVVPVSHLCYSLV